MSIKLTDLPQGALHGSQEVCITEAVVAGADVMEFKAEPLDLLKVVIHEEDLGEDRAAAATNHLRTVHLQTHAEVPSDAAGFKAD